MRKEKAVIFDLDYTISIPDPERIAKIKPELYVDRHQNWEDFYAGIPMDKPIYWNIEVLKQLACSYDIILLTSRSDELARKLTYEWLNKYEIPHDLLLMRDWDHHEVPCPEFKVEMYREFIESNWNVKFIVDDNKQIIDAFKAIGIPGFYCGD